MGNLKNDSMSVSDVAKEIKRLEKSRRTHIHTRNFTCKGHEEISAYNKKHIQPIDTRLSTYYKVLGA